MKAQRLFLAIILVLALLATLSGLAQVALAAPPSAPALQAPAWFHPDWSYRRPVTISNPSGGELTHYQVQVTLDSSFDFGNALSAGSDLRVTDADGETEIPFWIEEWDSVGETASIWVKVPLIPLASTTVYLYYGNPGASSASDGEATFEFFDDFETWGSESSSSWVEKEPLPSGKADNTAAVYNGKLYVFGGYGTSSGNWLNETYQYDPSSNTWTQKANMPTARWGPIAVEFDGLIHVFAGTAGSVHEVYDPSLDSWSTGTPVPSGLANQGLMGVRYGDKIHLFYQSAHYEYDPGSSNYIQKEDVPTPRTWGTCAVVGDKIYVIGGYSYGSPSGATNVNEIYTPATDSWTTGAPMPVSKYGVTRENPVINGKIYVTHGLNGGFHTDNYVYDPPTDSWEQRSPAIHPRDGMGCGVINDKLYVVGGRDVVGGPYGITYNEEYDPSTDTWTPPPPPKWTVTNPDKVHADESAAYEGSYGLLVDDDGAGYQYAEHIYSLAKPTLALDLYWNMTNDYGEVLLQPQSRILLTGSIAQGSLYYYRHTDGIPKFDWYTGGWTGCGDGSYNTWYPITIVWNGANSKVIVNGAEYPVSAASVSSDRIKLDSGPGETSKIYYDLVRVRKRVEPEPTVVVGPEEVEEPTAITLVSFSAEAGAEGVTLAWETGTEVDNAGFNLYRALTKDGPYTQINEALIAAQGDAVAGASYSFADAPGYGTFYYQLEDVDYYGVSTLHGPVKATVARPFRRPLRRPTLPEF